MAHKKACIKVLHCQTGILGEMREGFLYQPGIEIPGLRRAFLGLARGGPLFWSRNVANCVRVSNSC